MDETRRDGEIIVSKLTDNRSRSANNVLQLAAIGDKVPPHSADAEAAVLGAIMLDRNALSKATEVLEAESFYKEANRKIFEVMLSMSERNITIDLVSLGEELRRRSMLEAIGGTFTLLQINAGTPTAANVDNYIRIVQEHALKRQLISAASEVLARAYDPATDALEEIDKAESEIFRIAEKRLSKSYIGMNKLAKDTFATIAGMVNGEKNDSSVNTGYTKLDDMLGGFRKSDFIIIAARPSMGKCLSFDTELVLENGECATIEELYKRGNARLFTLHNDFKLRPTAPSHYIDDGIKPVFRVTTRLGKQVETTLTHPFLTIDGWKPLGELCVGTHIAVPRHLEAFGNDTMPAERVKFLAYLIGDGCLTKSSPEFTNSNPLLREEFIASARSFDGITTRLEDSNGTRTTTVKVTKDTHLLTVRRLAMAQRLSETLRLRDLSAAECGRRLGVSPSLVNQWLRAEGVPSEEVFVRLCAILEIEQTQLLGDAISSTTALRMSSKATPTLWLEEIGVWGHGAATKFIPACIFILRREYIALFLNRLFATDGWASVLASGQSQIGYASVSERLVRQVQHLLLRFGIIAALKRRSVKYKGERRAAWQLDITDHPSLLAFTREIGIFGKETAVERVAAALANRRIQTNKDLVPREIWQTIAQLKGMESWSSLAKRAGVQGWTNMHVHKRSLSSSRLFLLAEALQSTHLRNLAESDVYWDEIVSIDYVGEKQVYDLTIPDTHNFIAADICVHNTAVALSIARNVAMESNVPVAFFSIEMAKEQLTMRLLSAEARVSTHKLLTGNIKSDDLPRLATQMGRLSKAPIFIDDSPSLSVMELRAKCRRLKTEQNIGLVMIDYLQLMHAALNKGDSREREISIISRSLKQIAKELNIPVVALAQLNRGLEGRSDKRPMLSDLRESGSLEQDADVVMFVHRPEYYGIATFEEDGAPTEGAAELIIGKQRNGPVGSVRLAYVKEYTRFENLAFGQDAPPDYNTSISDFNAVKLMNDDAPF